MTQGIDNTPADPHKTPSRANVESIFPLLPNQQALLLARSIQPEDPGFVQVTFTLTGDLHVDQYADAWCEALRRHAGLRTSIRFGDNANPRVVVWRHVELPLQILDWRKLDDRIRRRNLADLLAADRKRGLDPAAEPVMRLQIIQLEEALFNVVWSCHHLFVDGWSAAIVLEDVMAIYRALTGRGTMPGPTPPGGLGPYVKRMLDADDINAREFWRQRLAGFQGAPRLVLGAADRSAKGYGELSSELDSELVVRVKAVSADLAVTPNAFVQCAWALLLGGLLDMADVVFGTTVAGRTVPIEGIERLVGYLSNAVPIRMEIDPGQSLTTWLEAARDAQFALQPFEHAILASVHEWSDVPGHESLFETFLVVANYPFGEAEAQQDGSVAHSDFDSGLTAVFPVTVAIGLGEPGFVRCRFELARCSTEAAQRIVDEFIETMRRMATRPQQMVGDILSQLQDGVTVPARAAQMEPVEPDVSRPPFRAPSDETEKRLVDIWAGLLDLPPAAIGVHDDYFALGGTSIAAVRLFGLIEDAFGKNLPLSALLSGATIAHLATLLRDEGAPGRGWKSLVPIQTAGTQPPISYLHARTGEVVFYRSLAQRLGPDQPVFGFEPIGLDGSRTPLDSIPEMAALYIQELRSAQPNGPYRLVGYCFGCIVALEMARQLEA